MDKIIKIGTRKSQLALWQANTVARKLTELGYKSKIVSLKSKGDLNLKKPIYEFGIVGVFTKTLDIALLNGEIDIAVHSMKDVPTSLPRGIVQAAVLERTNPHDILVYKDQLDFLDNTGIVATSSLRRKAQWLNRYPQHSIKNLRGNVHTRLRKIKENQWDGAIFAATGLERLAVLPQNFITLDWMVPAPAQGALMVVNRNNDPFTSAALQSLNDKKIQIETHIERQFLHTLEGGCSAPIGGLASFDHHTQKVHFHGVLLSLDGMQKCEIQKTAAADNWHVLGAEFAKNILSNGGTALMQKYREFNKK